MKESLRYLREKHKLSQSQVAARLNISRQTYIKLESGEAEPSVAQLRILADLYHVPVIAFVENRFSVKEAADDEAAPPANPPGKTFSGQVHRKEALYEIPASPPCTLASPPLVYEGVFDGTCVRPLNDDFPADVNQKVAITLLDEYVVDKAALIDKVRGILHYGADPSKWPLEEEAWAMHCVEKYGYLAKEREERIKREQEARGEIR